ncbi:MAG: hypothetical protein BWY85_00274 [Firmicutes bacterium ADurb.Bin506]|nr:MAG: hypothetical protein BWY85_00274 [Firmicutes bacterium ADurb.Bin506]
MGQGTKRLTTTVTAQTHYNLQKLADMAGYSTIGRVIDKLVRDHMLALRVEHTTNEPNKGGKAWQDHSTAGRRRSGKTR